MYERRERRSVLKQEITTTRERILEAALREFMKKGFREASLRGIAKAAGVTTGAFYGLFPDKHTLFKTLVEAPARQLRNMFIKAQEDFTLMDETDQAWMHDYSLKKLNEMLDYMYSHFTEFKLILSRSDGTEYSGFTDSLVEIETEYTYRYIDMINRTEKKEISLNPNLIHLLINGYFNAVFETIVHDLSREEAGDHVVMLWKFYSAGWDRLFNES